MQSQPISTQNIERVARLFIRFGVLLFPILIPHIFFSLFAKDDDEGIPNEELWEEDRRASSGVTGDGLQVLYWWLYSWTIRYSTSEEFLSSMIEEVLCLEGEGQLPNSDCINSEL